MTLFQTCSLPFAEKPSGPRTVTVLSGFLGSGKSTLLRSHLRQVMPRVPHVIVNDFAGTPVDDVAPEGHEILAVQLTGGCVCCTRRHELAQALRAMLDKGAAGQAGDVIIETSGLSDPGPIAFTVVNDPVLKHHFVLDQVCVTVDALMGLGDLERHAVATRQLLAADRIFITKADLVDATEVDALVLHLQRLNPSASITVTADGEPQKVVPPVPAHARSVSAEPPSVLSHVEQVSTLELQTQRPLDWQAFSVWLSLLLHEHGPSVLRVKGVLDVEGVGPVALNGVQHVVHRPEHLPAVVHRGTRLVLITQGLDIKVVERSFNVFLGLNGKGLSS